MKWLLTTLLASCMATGFCLEGWETDMDAARKKAAEQNKDLMIVYKGTDWHPERVGRPEKLLEYKPFQEKARGKFVLVEQATPPGALENNREPVLIFADAKGRPFYGFDSSLKQGFDWVVEEMKIAGEKKEGVLAQIASLEKAGQEERKECITRLWTIFPEKYASFSPAYELWKKESAQDSEKKGEEEESGEKIMNMVADALESKEVDDLQKMATGTEASENAGSKFKFLSIFWQFYSKLAKLQEKKELTPEKQMKEEKLAFENLDRLIAAEPGTKDARFGDIVVRNVLKGCGPMIRMAASNTEEDIANSRLKELEEMMKAPKWSLENRQLLECMYAVKLLRKGESRGVAKLKKAMETAPWTKNAAAMMEALPRLEANRGNFPRLRQKELKGDEEAKRQIEELASFKYTIDFEN